MLLLAVSHSENKTHNNNKPTPVHGAKLSSITERNQILFRILVITITITA